MAALHCPNPECPFLKKFRAPAEFREGFSTCSDCGSALAAGSAPAQVPAMAAAESAASTAVSAPHAAGVSGELSRRVAISLAVLIAAALSEQVMLPGLDPYILETLEGSRMMTDSALPLGVFSLALNPLVTAFVLVELAALLIPPWRRLRTGGPRSRARLRTASVVLGLVFAAIQSFGMVQFYSTLNFEGRTLFSGPDSPSMPVIVLLLIGGVLVLHLLTVLVDRAGLGNGYAVVLLGLSVPPALGTLIHIWNLAQQGTVGTAELALIVLSLVGIVWATVRMLRGRVPGSGGGTERPRWLSLPTSGLAPLSLAGGLLSLPTILSNLLGLPLLVEANQTLQGSVVLYSLAFFVLLTLLTAGFSVLFHQPRRVGAVWAALTAKDAAERPVVQGRAALRTRELLPTAAAWSLAFTTLAWLPPQVALYLLAVPFPSALAVLVGVAIVVDLLDEARRRRAGTWIPAWPVHRVYEVEPALAALSAAGIPAWARGVHARSTLHFFAPYFPIELMVPPERTEEAHALLEKAHQA